MESSRTTWYVASPMWIEILTGTYMIGTPHSTSTADIYEGMYIPKGEQNFMLKLTRALTNAVLTGSIVLVNLWQVFVLTKRIIQGWHSSGQCATTRKSILSHTSSNQRDSWRLRVKSTTILLYWPLVLGEGVCEYRLVVIVYVIMFIRICVGRHFADATVWAAIVSLLSVFTFAPVKSDDGDDISITPNFCDGLSRSVSSIIDLMMFNWLNQPPTPFRMLHQTSLSCGWEVNPWNIIIALEKLIVPVGIVALIFED